MISSRHELRTPKRMKILMPYAFCPLPYFQVRWVSQKSISS